MVNDMFAFCRRHSNDSSFARKLFIKSLNAVPASDWPELIVKQWLKFEREEGGLQDMSYARLKYAVSMEICVFKYFIRNNLIY